jgi:hypothetical protein
MEVQNINNQMLELKAQIKGLVRKKDLAIKNEKYKNDPEYKARLMKRNRDYYTNKIRPNKVFKYQKCLLKNPIDKPKEETQEENGNPLENAFC